jgi:hypothetical protein
MDPQKYWDELRQRNIGFWRQESCAKRSDTRRKHPNTLLPKDKEQLKWFTPHNLSQLNGKLGTVVHKQHGWIVDDIDPECVVIRCWHLSGRVSLT